ncbi:unnamed protein product [Knipowitschia caucasica]|uniref:EF-hand domain-containing protein n=1 Tax=Knipowitschia caucasica TaxID=637954 RepID=A0AAV2LA25_KNICA
MDNRDTMMPDDHYSSKQEKTDTIKEMDQFLGRFYSGHSEEELRALHMQIDANCDGSVDFNELLDFELGKHFAAKNRPFDNIFPLPIEIVDGGHHNKIVKIVARLADMPEKTTKEVLGNT